MGGMLWIWTDRLDGRGCGSDGSKLAGLDTPYLDCYMRYCMRQGSTVLLKPHHLAAFPLHQVEKKRRSRAFKVGTFIFEKVLR